MQPTTMWAMTPLQLLLLEIFILVNLTFLVNAIQFRVFKIDAIWLLFPNDFENATSNLAWHAAFLTINTL